MAAPRTPKTTAAATALLERFAALGAQLAKIEADRNAAIAAANATADGLADPLLKEHSAILEKLEPWWAGAAAELTSGKRKSVQLGGCMIGTRAGRAALDVAGDEDAAIAEVAKLRGGKSLLRYTVKLDRKAITAALGGKLAEPLKALGFAIRPAAETFYVEAVAQAGTLASSGLGHNGGPPLEA